MRFYSFFLPWFGFHVGPFIFCMHIFLPFLCAIASPICFHWNGRDDVDGPQQNNMVMMVNSPFRFATRNQIYIPFMQPVRTVVAHTCCLYQLIVFIFFFSFIFVALSSIYPTVFMSLSSFNLPSGPRNGFSHFHFLYVSMLMFNHGTEHAC